MRWLVTPAFYTEMLVYSLLACQLVEVTVCAAFHGSKMLTNKNHCTRFRHLLTNEMLTNLLWVLRYITQGDLSC